MTNKKAWGLLSVVFVAMSAGSALAVDPYDVCKRVNDAYKTSCLDSVRRYQYFDFAALDVCNANQSSSLTVDCVNTVGDRRFTPVAVKVCARENDAYKNSCLSAVADGFFEENAAAVCNSVQSSPVTIDCMRAVRDHQYFQPDALHACSRVNDVYKTSCLSVIADRYLNSRAVEICDSMQSSPQTVDCLRGAITQ